MLCPQKIAFNETIPLVYGGLSQWEGQVCFFDPKSDSICFGCIFPNDPGQAFEDSCLNFGIIGPIVGVIGSLMAAEVIKFLTFFINLESLKSFGFLCTTHRRLRAESKYQH